MTFGAAGSGGPDPYGAAPAALNTSGSVGADTTAQVGGSNPRGQVLGVPEGYVPPLWVAGYGPAQRTTVQGWRMHTGGMTGDPSPQILHHDPYREADAWNPASTPQNIPDLQQKLIKAGLLDPTATGYQPGLWGPNEVAAWKSVLSNANVNGIDADTMLGYMLDHPGYSANPTKQITLSSPISVQAAFESAMHATLGTKPSAAQTAAFVKAWQSYETQSLTGQAAGQVAFQKDPTSAPKSLTDTASPSDFAQQYIDTNFASQEAGVGYQHGLDLIGNLIGSTKGAGG